MNELSRRTLLTAGLAVTTLVANGPLHAKSLPKPLKPRAAEVPLDVLARDEDYWRTVAAQ